jgi:uncharacterized protein YggE
LTCANRPIGSLESAEAFSMIAFIFPRATPGLVSLLLGFAGLLSASADAPVRKVTVIGTAIIKVVPDEMHWTVQVSINDATLAKAKDRHDASLDAALKYIKGLGDAAKDLQTGGIRFDKNLYPGDNPEARKNPFSCSTQFTFTLTDFSQYGPIADVLSKLDGVQVQSVDYASSLEAPTRRDALKRALLDAHDKASDLAVTANCYIDKPLEIDEQDAFDVHPEMMNTMMAARSSGGTPDAVAGQIQITGKVIVTYDLYYK